MYLIGRIADKTDVNSDNGLVEINGQNLIVDQNAFLLAIAQNYGGGQADYALFRVPSGGDADRILNGDEFDLVWVGDNITGIDFGKEDAKFILDVIINGETPNPDGETRGYVMADNVDTLRINVSVFESDGITPKNIAGTRVLEFFTPDKRVVALPIAFGGSNAASFMVQTMAAGDWQFPAKRNRIELGAGVVVRVRSYAIVKSRFQFGVSI